MTNSTFTILRNSRVLFSQTTTLISLNLFIFCALFYSFDISAQQECLPYGEEVNYISPTSSDGYLFEVWQNKEQLCYEENPAGYGGLSANWGKLYNGGNALARKAIRPGVKNQRINYYMDNNLEGNSFFGAYGWWKDPNRSGAHAIVEYYVVEGYGSYRPSDDMGDPVGTVYSDQETYDIYVSYRENQPSVYPGENNFYQIKSVRRNHKGSGVSQGTITMANHFNKWAELYWPAGDLFEVSFKAEGYGDTSHGNCYLNASMDTAGSYAANSGVAQSISNGTYELVAESGAFLEATAGGALLKSRNNPNGNKTRWRFEHLANNVYHIYSKEYNQRLEIPYAASGSGKKIGITGWTGNGDHMRWKAVQVGNKYQFIPMHDQARALDAWKGNSNVVHTHNKNTNNSNQKFTLYYKGAKREAPITTTETAITKTTKTIDKEIKLYPNPASSQLNIDLSGYELNASANAKIYDLSGRIVKEITSLQTATAINVESLPNGSYMIMIETGLEGISKMVSIR